MSIATEISRLQTAKADLKTSIENKGVTVPSETTLDGYAALVDQISSGGGITTTEVANATGTTLEITSSSGGGETVRVYDYGGFIQSVAWLDANGDAHNSMLIDEDYNVYCEPLIGSIVAALTASEVTHTHLQVIFQANLGGPAKQYAWLVV